MKSRLRYFYRTPTTHLGIWVHFSTHFKSIFLFQKHRSFQRHFLASFLTTPLSCTSPNISEISLHYTTRIHSQPLIAFSNPKKYQKICDQSSSQLFFRVRCWDVFFVLRNLSQLTTASTTESIYTFILSVWNCLLELCISASNLHTICLKQKFINLLVSWARPNQTMECCNFINNQLKPDSHLLFATV